MITLKITERPTFDLTEIEILAIWQLEKILFLKSKQVFKFDCVFGNLENRSRVLRLDREESKYVEYVISATIDAGFCGHLVWKIKLTKAGVDLFNQNLDTNNKTKTNWQFLNTDSKTDLETKKIQDTQKLTTYFSNCQQIHLFESPAKNYYDGTNQTDLEPDVIFGV